MQLSLELSSNQTPVRETSIEDDGEADVLEDLSASPAILHSELPVENNNWWYSDGSYHLNQTTLPAPLHFSKPHHTVDPLVTFKPMPAPTHVTLSPGLARLMKSTMEAGASLGRAYSLQFDDLFKIDTQKQPHVDIDGLMKEKKLNIKMNTVKYPRKSAYQVDVNDRDNSLSSVATDESFQLCDDKLNDDCSYQSQDCEENPNYVVESHGNLHQTHENKVSTRLLLEEVDGHLMHLKKRLRTMSARSSVSPNSTQNAGARSARYRGQGPPKYDKLTISMSNTDGTYQIDKRDFEEAVRMVTKAPPRKWKKATPNAAMIGKNYSTHPTPDPIDLLNRRILNEIDQRDIVPISELQGRYHVNSDEKLALATVPRQVGGSNTAMIKRTVAPFRKTGKLRGRSLPLAITRAAIHGGSTGCRITSYGECADPSGLRYNKPNCKPFDFSMILGEVKSGQKTSVINVGCLPHINVKADPPLYRPVTAESQPEAKDTRSSDPSGPSGLLELPPQVPLDGVQVPENPFVSTPDMLYYELNLLKKDDLDMSGANFDAISSILAQLRADEQHLITLLRDTEGVRTNSPNDAWHASKGTQFLKGLAQTNALLTTRKEALDKIADYRRELGIIEQADIDVNSRTMAHKNTVKSGDHSLYANTNMNTLYSDSKYVDLTTGIQHMKNDSDAETLIQRIITKDLSTAPQDLN